MRVRVLPYKQGSKSAKVLSDVVGARVLKLRDSRYTPRTGDVVINWGSSTLPDRLAGAKIINPPDKVARATNKLTFFNLMQVAESHLIPEYWTSKESIPADAYPIVCRTILNGHSGAGIVIANTAEELVAAPLYVKYIKKTDEYRIHVGSGQVIAVQRKARNRATPDDQVNWQIRNHDNGFIFMRQNVAAPATVTSAAIRALIVTGLDFGAIDVVYQERAGVGTAKVLEVNTAPGMSGTTVDDYAKYFTNIGE